MIASAILLKPFMFSVMFLLLPLPASPGIASILTEMPLCERSSKTCPRSFGDVKADDLAPTAERRDLTQFGRCRSRMPPRSGGPTGPKWDWVLDTFLAQRGAGTAKRRAARLPAAMAVEPQAFDFVWRNIPAKPHGRSGLAPRKPLRAGSREGRPVGVH